MKDKSEVEWTGVVVAKEAQTRDEASPGLSSKARADGWAHPDLKSVWLGRALLSLYLRA